MTPARLFLLALLCLAVYFAVFGGEYSLIEQVRVERRHTAAAAELEAERAALDSLRARADSLENDPAVLERLARERYGLIRDGELLYRFVEVPDEAGPEEPDGVVPDTAAADAASPEQR